MNCKYVSRLISDYVDGSLEDNVKAELDVHFGECEQCASDRDATERLVASLSTLGGLRSPVDCWRGVQVRISPGRQLALPWWRWLLKPVVAAPAAAVMAVLALLLAWPLSQPLPLSSDEAFAPEYSYYIAAHSRLQRRQAFADPEAVFLRAELQKAALLQGSAKR